MIIDLEKDNVVRTKRAKRCRRVLFHRRVVHKGGSRATVFDPTGHGGARNPECAGEAMQAAAFLIGMQDLLAASFWIGMGNRVLATLTSAGAAAIQLLAIRGVTIANESFASFSECSEG